MIRAASMVAAVVVAVNAGKTKDLTKADKKTMTLNSATSLQDVGLDATCSPPTKLGGVGYCGPDYCEDAEKWSCTGSGKCAVCTYIRGSNQMGQTFNSVQPFDYQKRLDMISYRPCKQSTDFRCESDFLYNSIVDSGIKAAYCNENFLVVHTDLTGGFTPWLTDIPNPPGGGEDHDRTDQTDTGIFCQTGPESLYEEYGIYKFPLTTHQLDGDDYTNNLNLESFPNGCHRNNPGSHMCERAGAGHDWGHPVRGPVGITITGMEVFPVYNNMGYLEPQKCEVDSCNAHVGAGGGQTHIHGDPFGSWCMYDIDNYTSVNHHPPQIGWFFDGHVGYGRYLSETSLGFDVPLDGCGGHTHDDLGYHYHSQVFEAVTDAGRYNPPMPTYDDFIAEGMPYIATTPGPYVCLKGDIGKIVNYWSNWRGEQKVQSSIYVVPDPTMDMCLNAPNKYVLTGLKLNNHKRMEDFYAFREALDDETKAMIAANDEYDAMLLQYAAETGKKVIALEDWVKSTDTYEEDDKMTIEEVIAKAAVPVIAEGTKKIEIAAAVTETVIVSKDDTSSKSSKSASTDATTTTTTKSSKKSVTTDATATAATASTSSKDKKSATKEATTTTATPVTTTKTKDVTKSGKAGADAAAPVAEEQITTTTSTEDKKAAQTEKDSKVASSRTKSTSSSSKKSEK